VRHQRREPSLGAVRNDQFAVEFQQPVNPHDDGVSLRAGRAR
jgi:hypothetical protein